MTTTSRGDATSVEEQGSSLAAGTLTTRRVVCPVLWLRAGDLCEEAREVLAVACCVL